MADKSLGRRVAAMLAAYEARTIDSDELYTRLLLAGRAGGPESAELAELALAVDEASDLGRDEREEIAWAAATYWRRLSQGG